MVDNNIFGCHSSFYYCGLGHLIINMYKYIRDGVDRREKIYICTDFTVYFKLSRYLGRYSEHVEYFDAVEMINYYREMGFDSTRIKLSECVDRNTEKGYAGLRFIMQIDYVISQTSQKDFLCFDKNISHMISGTKASFMCIYDFEDYLNNRDIINNEIVKKSYKNHFFRLFCGKLRKWNKLLI
ncbi:MEDS domain-containing protein [uncultured Clostridium sp.]|uniref:MEDS domain-containing protein n=1 Tax=uncultured Clostridium sp. TaxID=59620 RepID=UPI0025F673D8|nr:MEDS domain-containing protein [uncultured Clostridium sp.]